MWLRIPQTRNYSTDSSTEVNKMPSESQIKMTFPQANHQASDTK